MVAVPPGGEKLNLEWLVQTALVMKRLSEALHDIAYDLDQELGRKTRLEER